MTPFSKLALSFKARFFIVLVILCHFGFAYRLQNVRHPSRHKALLRPSNTLYASPSSTPATASKEIKVDGIWKQLGELFTPKSLFGDSSSTPFNTDKFKSKKDKIDTAIYDADIAKAKALLLSAAMTKAEEGNSVVEALSNLEKLMRKKNAIDDNETSRETLKNLKGAWRLVFTTGTADTQKKIGRINYFPLKAVQAFDTDSMRITNGIYVGSVALLRFYGSFSWLEKARKLEFDFDRISVLGLKFTLPQGGAAKIGQSTGLGSENNVELKKRGQQPFFNWISADDKIATARGGGGGLALWKRLDDEDEKKELATMNP